MARKSKASAKAPAKTAAKAAAKAPAKTAAKAPAKAPALITRGDLSPALGVSKPTIDKWCLPGEFEGGLPCIRQGGNGRAYGYDLQACKEWRERRDGHRDFIIADRNRQIAEARPQLDLAGGDAKGVDALSLRTRREYYETEMGRMKAAKLRGELVNLADVEAEFAEVFQAVARFMQSLPDTLARECDLEAALIGILQEKIDTHQATLARLFMSDRDLQDVA